MSATVPAGPLESDPGGFWPQEDRLAVLAGVLDGVELGEGTIFVLGAEREGLPEHVIAACDAAASIPLAEGSESLNVSAAGAIALYEWKRCL